jgi:hypothetical protein
MVVPGDVGDRVTVRTATTPFWMRFALSPPEPSPVRKQVYKPAVAAHERDLPAAVAEVPALALMATTSVGE